MHFRGLHPLQFTLLALSPTWATAQPFELTFWPSPAAATDPRVTRTLEHPCGEVVMAKVSKIPPYKKDGVLIPERVFELDARNRIVAEWAMPVDSTVRAVKGSSLVVQHGTSTYEITRRGEIKLFDANGDLPESKPFECKTPSALEPSAYARCERFKDLQSKRFRILSYEMACT